MGNSVVEQSQFLVDNRLEINEYIFKPAKIKLAFFMAQRLT